MVHTTRAVFAAIALSLRAVPTLAAPVVRDSNVLGARANVNTVLFTRGICASRPACLGDSSSTRPRTAPPPTIPPTDHIDPVTPTPFRQTARVQILAGMDPRTHPTALTADGYSHGSSPGPPRSESFSPSHESEPSSPSHGSSSPSHGSSSPSHGSHNNLRPAGSYTNGDGGISFPAPFLPNGLPPLVPHAHSGSSSSPLPSHPGSHNGNNEITSTHPIMDNSPHPPASPHSPSSSNIVFAHFGAYGGSNHLSAPIEVGNAYYPDSHSSHSGDSSPPPSR